MITAAASSWAQFFYCSWKQPQQRLSKGISLSEQLHQVEEWHEQSKHRNCWIETDCNRMCTPGRRGSCSRSLTGPVLMPFVAWSNAQILKLNPISTTPKCRVHLSIASVKEWFSSALITMVTPPRAKNIWLLLLSNQARFPVIRAIAAKWLMATLHRSPGSARTCNEPPPMWQSAGDTGWQSFGSTVVSTLGLMWVHQSGAKCQPWLQAQRLPWPRQGDRDTEEMHGGDSRGFALGFQKAPSALHLRTSKI